MADPSDLFPGLQRHGPITLSPVLEIGSGSDTEDPPTLPSLDLFHRRRAPAVSPDPDPGLHNLELGLGFPAQEDQDRARHRRHDQQDEEVFENWDGEDFFIGRRSSGRGNEEGLRMFGFESDPDPGLPLCLDCLQISEGDRRNPSASTEEFEWEEIDVISTVIREEDYQDDISFELGGIIEAANPSRTGIEWEVLHHLVDTETDTYYMDDGFEDDFVYTSGYDDLLFGQFREHGGRPAAKSVVESLPTVVGENDLNCAVCKDEILAEEKAKKLPCCHYYHEECILRWLGMRSTCPLCRYELPTDDVEYENRKARRAGSNGGEN